MAKQKDKFYRLGEKAQLFVDPMTKTKILPNQIVKVEGKDNSSEKIKTAVRLGHIQVATEAEFKEYEEATAKYKEEKAKGGTPEPVKLDTPAEDDEDEDTDSEDIKAFKAKSRADMLAQLEEDYDFDDEEWKRISGLKKKEDIVEEYRKLLADEGDDDDDDDTQD